MPSCWRAARLISVCMKHSSIAWQADCHRHGLADVPARLRPLLGPLAGLSFLAFLSYALFFHRRGDRELESSHEARAAQDAASLLATGPGELPRLFDRRAELQKPPLYYWLVAACA